MSDSLALVRFPDGDLRVAYYFGSMDMVVQPLFAVADADAVFAGGMPFVLERLSEVEADDTEVEDIEDVEIWTAYGGGAWWNGRASRTGGVIIEGVDPYGASGAPLEYRRDVTDGVPDWVPSGWRG